MLKSLSFQYRNLPNILTMMMLVAWAATIYRNTLNQFPSHVHAWTQSDRYALTMGYLENGYGIFKPSTPNLWPKYPPLKMPQKLEGITKADLPLSEYIAAHLMKWTGIRQPMMHRGINLLFSLTALFFLFMLMRHMGAQLMLAWLGLAFAMLAPAYAYYLDGFIPGIPAISLTLTAYFFLHRYACTHRQHYLAISFLLIGLAALIRPPFLMALPAFIIAVLYATEKPLRLNALVFGAIILLAFGLLQLHNIYLAKNYGSLFISALMPARNISEWIDLAQESLARWKFDYFSPTHYFILVVAVFLLLAYRHQLKANHAIRVVFAAALHFVAAFLYFTAMARQFPDHDYYFVESFFPPLVILTASGLSLPKADTCLRRFLFALAVLLAVWRMADAMLVNREKRYTTQPWDMTETTRKLFDESAVWLDRIGISRNARMLVWDSYTTNVPLLLMERKGFTVINTNRQNLSQSLSLPFDYIVIPNRSLPADILRNMPELQGMLEPLANNGNLGVYRLDTTGLHLNNNLNSLLLPSHIATLVTAESLVRMDQTTTFAELALVELHPTNSRKAILFEAKAEAFQKVKDFYLVIDLSFEGKNLFYDSFRLDPYFEENFETRHLYAYINLPEIKVDGVKLKCYLWNKGSNTMVLRNISVNILAYDNLKSIQNEKH